MLLQKMIKRKQNESGDEEGLALIYKNTKNNKNMQLNNHLGKQRKVGLTRYLS